MALNCIGMNQTQATPSLEEPMPSSSQSKRGQSDFESLDPEIVNKIKILEQAKEKAVSNEHFDEAKQIKEGIERLRSVGLHV